MKKARDSRFRQLSTLIVAIVFGLVVVNCILSLALANCALNLSEVIQQCTQN